MTPEKLVAPTLPLKEVIEKAAKNVLENRTGKLTLLLHISSKQLSLPLTEETYRFYEEQVLPILQEVEQVKGERLSKYPHRNLCTAVVQILKKNTEYDQNIIIELEEEWEPDTRFPPKHGVIHTVSTFKAINLIRRDKFNKPRWMPKEIPDLLFAYTKQ
jgi:hypothetical protein